METGQRWQRHGVQSDDPYLTYRAYCDECARERIKPVGIHRFRSLMTRAALRIAPEDYGPIEKWFERDGRGERAGG